MRGVGKMTLEKGMAMRNMTTQTSTLAIFRKEKLMGRDFTHGRMGSTMKESGREVRNMGLESGREMEENLTQGTGSRAKLMELEHTSGRMETCTRGAGSIV